MNPFSRWCAAISLKVWCTCLFLSLIWQNMIHCLFFNNLKPLILSPLFVFHYRFLNLSSNLNVFGKHLSYLDWIWYFDRPEKNIFDAWYCHYRHMRNRPNVHDNNRLSARTRRDCLYHHVVSYFRPDWDQLYWDLFMNTKVVYVSKQCWRFAKVKTIVSCI